MSTLLSNVPGIGKPASIIFEKAGILTERDLFRKQFEIYSIKDILCNLKNEYGRTDEFWKLHYNRCINISSRAIKGKQVKLEQPDYLLCPITGELMRDPVITEWGVTYERDNIEEYFKNKKIPPECDIKIDFEKQILISNKAILRAIEHYTDQYRYIII